jgi:choline-sulfatase
MDAQIGRILDALRQTGQMDNTYIFFTADHGLAVGHHGLMGKQNLFDHSVRVPLMVVGPGVEAGRRISAPVYLQDIMPSTLQLAGIPRPDSCQFRSLMPLVDGREAQTHDAIYGAYLDLQRMVTVGPYKLILYPRADKILLYNLENDPHEMHDLAGDPQNQPVIKRLFARLLKLQEATGDRLDLKAAFPQLD